MLLDAFKSTRWPAGVAQLVAVEHFVAEIVIACEVGVPTHTGVGATYDGDNLQGSDNVQAGRYRLLWRIGFWSEDNRFRPTLGPAWWWQGEPTIALHGEHNQPGAHVLQPTTRR